MKNEERRQSIIYRSRQSADGSLRLCHQPPRYNTINYQINCQWWSWCLWKFLRNQLFNIAWQRGELCGVYGKLWKKSLISHLTDASLIVSALLFTPAILTFSFYWFINSAFLCLRKLMVNRQLKTFKNSTLFFCFTNKSTRMGVRLGLALQSGPPWAYLSLFSGEERL